MPDSQRMTAEQDLKTCMVQLKKTNIRMNKAVKKGQSPVVNVQRSQQLYADHMQVSEATAQSALALVQIVLEVLAAHEIEIPHEAKRLLDKQPIGSKEAPEASRSNTRKRSEEAHTLLADSPPSQKRRRQENDRELEPGEISE